MEAPLFRVSWGDFDSSPSDISQLSRIFLLLRNVDELITRFLHCPGGAVAKAEASRRGLGLGYYLPTKLEIDIVMLKNFASSFWLFSLNRFSPDCAGWSPFFYARKN